MSGSFASAFSELHFQSAKYRPRWASWPTIVRGERFLRSSAILKRSQASQSVTPSLQASTGSSPRSTARLSAADVILLSEIPASVLRALARASAALIWVAEPTRTRSALEAKSSESDLSLSDSWAAANLRVGRSNRSGRPSSNIQGLRRQGPGPCPGPASHAACELTRMRRTFSLAAADRGRVTVSTPFLNVALALSRSIPRGRPMRRSKRP